MNQTRIFLIFAWLMVATLLWMEWGKFNAPKPDAVIPPTAQPAADRSSAGAVPGAPTAVAAPVDAALPAAPNTSAVAAPVSAINPRVVVSSDVLRLTIDGGSVLDSALLKYPQTKASGSPPVVLFNQDPARLYEAQSGWTSTDRVAPTHLAGFVPENDAKSMVMEAGQAEISVPFLWRGANGVTIRRTYTLRRNDYAVTVRDEVVNNGGAVWQGEIYRQLVRVPPAIKSGMTNPESFSFTGAVWYDGEYNRRPFVEGWFAGEYLVEGENQVKVTGGWIAMPQHHFFSAWIPDAKSEEIVELAKLENNNTVQHLIREKSAAVISIAPGQRYETTARLWVGPKLISSIKAQGVPALDRAVDYSRYSIFAVIGKGLFWILNHLHALLGNWGWSIIGLVVLVKLALWPLSAAQYRSANKMRQFQPRIAQLKERYGDDRQKFQMAQMELYKKEKINPMGGCLPILVTMPIFLALYYVINETVELRQAPWFAWIQDLTARDPYFILPALNMLVMWRTQKMTPAVGMDPMQQKMMQFMPLVFGGMMALFPSGLVLYWVTNGSLGLLQQWWLGRHLKMPGAPEDKDKEKEKDKPKSKTKAIAAK